VDENLIHQLIPHQGCVITRTDAGITIASSAMNWDMSAGVVSFVCDDSRDKRGRWSPEAPISDARQGSRPVFARRTAAGLRAVP
jgi:hypothetical protein